MLKLKIIIKFQATASSGIRKIFRVVIYLRQNMVSSKMCEKRARMGGNVLEV